MRVSGLSQDTVGRVNKRNLNEDEPRPGLKKRNKPGSNSLSNKKSRKQRQEEVVSHCAHPHGLVKRY